jgi:hypothetical protein
MILINLREKEIQLNRTALKMNHPDASDEVLDLALRNKLSGIF